MPPRNEVSTLHCMVNSFIVARIKEYRINHNKSCCFCKGTIKHSSLQKLLWEDKFAASGVNITFDCPVVVRTVDLLISYIPSAKMKIGISEYLSWSEDDTLEYAIMDLLHCHSSRGTYCSKIKSLVKKFGLLSFYADPNLELEELKHFLPLAPNLITLDLKSVEPTTGILEMIGKECNFLRNILNLQILHCSSKGLKKMLFSDSCYTVRRNICNSLRYFLTVFDDWPELHTSDKVIVCTRWYLILKNCPNIEMMQEKFNCAQALRLIKECKSYAQDKITKVSFSYVPNKEDVRVVAEFYPRITHLDIFIATNIDLNFYNFKNVTCFHYGGIFDDIHLFLEVQGRVLLEFQFIICSEDEFAITFDLNKVSVLCPNLKKLTLYCSKYAFTHKPVSFNYLETLLMHNIMKYDDPGIFCIAEFLASLPSLLTVALDRRIGTHLTRNWINTVIGFAAFRKLELILIGICPLLKIDDVTRLIYACPKLQIFIYEGFPQITENELEDLKLSTRQQNLDFEMQNRYHI